MLFKEAINQLFPESILRHIRGRVNLQSIIANIGWLFFDKFLRMGVGLFVGVWIARYLGPEQYGIYNYALAFVALFSSFSTFGLDSIVIRDIVRNPSLKDEILGTAFVLKLTGGATTLLITIYAITLLQPNDKLTRYLVGIISAGMIFQAFDTIDFWFQAQVKSKYTVVAKNAAFLLVALIKICLIILKASLIAFALAGLIETILGSIGLLLAYRIHGQYLKAWRSNLHRASVLIKDSWPLIFSGLAIMIYVKIDQIMLGEMVGKDAVGIYSAATRISEVWYFIPVTIAASVYPSIIDAKRVSEELYYHRIQKLLRLNVCLSYVIAITISAFSGMIIIILFGQNYSSAGTVLAIHIWAILAVSLGVTRSPWVINEGYTRSALVITCLGAAANILLNLLLIPMYHEIGAAIATVISYTFSDYVINIIYRPYRKIGALMTNVLLFKRATGNLNE